MSCLGPGYNPQPPRAWSRVQNKCTYVTPNTLNETIVYIPALKKSIPLGDVEREIAMINKGNILQYKDNSANTTKAQKYSLIVNGSWNRKKSWASQTQTTTIPNANSFKRINYPYSIPITPGTYEQSLSLCQNNSVPDGGQLNARLVVNQCTGAIIQRFPSQNCFPTSASNVPGPVINLCYNNNVQTWYPKKRYIMTNSEDKFPVGYKKFVSANAIPNANASSRFGKYTMLLNLG
jgi:hypothetical protein